MTSPQVFTGKKVGGSAQVSQRFLKPSTHPQGNSVPQKTSGMTQFREHRPYRNGGFHQERRRGARIPCARTWQGTRGQRNAKEWTIRGDRHTLRSPRSFHGIAGFPSREEAGQSVPFLRAPRPRIMQPELTGAKLCDSEAGPRAHCSRHERGGNCRRRFAVADPCSAMRATRSAARRRDRQCRKVLHRTRIGG